MEIKRHEPEPVTPPPPTYDITGLTEDEVQLLRDILGVFAAGGPTEHIYKALRGALREELQSKKYKILNKVDWPLQVKEREAHETLWFDGKLWSDPHA